MKKKNTIKDLSIYNINSYSSKFSNKHHTQKIPEQKYNTFINKFTLECVIGKGGFGKVWKVKYRLNGKFYAMKIMSKVKIIKKNSIKNVLNEKQLLSKLHNPFLVNMIFSFQDKDNLYLIMDLLLGGDLRYHLNKSVTFNENQLRFFLSCAILGLDYLHQNQIIHKDIKPENLVFDINGYLHITDLGISKIYHEENKKENSGTPGYMAPEVLFNKNHDYSVDFFALGVIGYEIIKRKRPYLGKDKKELRKEVISRQAKLEEEDVNTLIWSTLCLDFINGLLKRKGEHRLGKNGTKELMEHPWFKDFNWNKLKSQKMEPDWKPPFEENYYHDFGIEEEIGKDTEQCYEEIKNREEYDKYFEDYSFNEKDLIGKDNENEKEEKEEKNELNKKIKLKYELTSKIINKLKQEIKKFSFSNINYLNKKDKSLYKSSIRFSDIGTKKADYPNTKKNEKTSLRLTKSYYLYNFNSKENNLKTSNRFNNDSNSIVNLSTKYNSKEIKKISVERFKFNNKSNDNKNFYRSNYNNKFLSGPRYNNKIRLNFNSTKNYLHFNNMSHKQLPLIKQLKKSSSVVNFDKINKGKKSRLIIDYENNQYQNNLVNS